MGPIQSTDVYWNLANAYNFLQGFNPYLQPLTETPSSAYSIFAAWHYVPMTHGPLSVLLYALPLTLNLSTGATFFILRIIWMLPILLTLHFMNKLLNAEGLPRQNMKLNKLLAYLFSAPILVFGLVDLHNDIFVMLSICAAYFFLTQKKHRFAVLALVLGFLIKYVTLLLLPLVLWDWFRSSRDALRGAFFEMAKYGLASLTLVVLSYLPFLVNNWDFLSLFHGLSFQINFAVADSYPVYGVLVGVKNFIGISGSISPFVLPVLVLLSVILWEKNKKYEAFILPILLLISSTSWVTPWYYLWFFPLLLIRYDRESLALFFAILLPFVHGFYTNTYLLLFVFVHLLVIKPFSYLQKSSFSNPSPIEPTLNQ